MIDHKLDKVIKLLAMAEGASTPEESAAYMERAQHLATINAIELELVYARQREKEKREEPTMKRVTTGEIGRPHFNRFGVDLLIEIGHVNDLKLTISHDRSSCNLFGYDSDIAVTEILFTSLMTQMVQAAEDSLRRGEHKQAYVHGRTWRLNLYEAFIFRIGQRMRQARRDALAEQKKRDDEIAERLGAVLLRDADAAAVPAPEPAITGALVMVRKAEHVSEYYQAHSNARGSYRSYGAGTKAYSAQSAGRAAADKARIGNQGSVAGGPRKALG